MNHGIGKKPQAVKLLIDNPYAPSLNPDEACWQIKRTKSSENGFSSSPTNSLIDSFYSNPGWHDDTADGSVQARIHRANGQVIDAIAPSWVIITTPDYAPGISGVVTLYDVLTQVSIDHFNVPAITRPSFTDDVYPLLLRAHNLKWVNENSEWTDVNTDWPALADDSSAAANIRAHNAKQVRDIETALARFRLTDTQHAILNAWESGNFDSDWTSIPTPDNLITLPGLTQAALEGTLGQGFFPGIEAGILMQNHMIYTTPFDYRIDPSVISPGDLTALMAVPWQADFYECKRAWWPAQRPDKVHIDTAGTTEE